ncbi:MAG: glycosyltransferase family 1 protein, partial [archaeon]|nr:glycosyltransferase family 1 protein [archaeon]
MRALISVTGRGLGGDAVIALNLIKALEECGVECEIALDESA